MGGYGDTQTTAPFGNINEDFLSGSRDDHQHWDCYGDAQTTAPHSETSTWDCYGDALTTAPHSENKSRFSVGHKGLYRVAYRLQSTLEEIIRDFLSGREGLLIHVMTEDSVRLLHPISDAGKIIALLPNFHIF